MTMTGRADLERIERAQRTTSRYQDIVGINPRPITYTAACPTCGTDATWTATPVPASSGEWRPEYVIDCPTCDDAPQAVAA